MNKSVRMPKIVGFKLTVPFVGSTNKPEDFILAIVEFVSDIEHNVHYVREPFKREPDFGVTSVNYDFSELLLKSKIPS